MSEHREAGLARLVRRLVALRADLVGERSEVEADLSRLAEETEPELVERGQEQDARSRLAQLGERELYEIEEIDAALARVRGGTYGRCDGCGADIRLARLRAVPASRWCVDCAAAREGLERAVGAGI